MNLPNWISVIRLPLALLFLFASFPLRFLILGIALLTDGLDGYLARRWSLQTSLGATLDPVTDKVFVITALVALYNTSVLEPWQIISFFSRDIALFLFSSWLLVTGRIYKHQVRSVWPGKVTTFLQFATLALLTAGFPIPFFLWWLFIALGAAFLLDFLLHPRALPTKQ